MTDREVRDLGRKLLDEHGLAHWNFTLNPRPVRRAGCCHYPRVPFNVLQTNPDAAKEAAGTIEVSSKFSRENDTYHVTDVVLHEIAHAKTGRGAPAHGALFKKNARAIGCRSTGGCTIPTSKSAKGKYRAICPDPDCDFESYRTRLPRYGRRNSCGNPVHGDRGFKQEFVLTWVLTKDYETEAPRYKRVDGVPAGEPLQRVPDVRGHRFWCSHLKLSTALCDCGKVATERSAPKKKKQRLAPVVKGHAVGDEQQVDGGWRIVCQCGCDWWNKKKLDGIKAHRRHKKEVQAHGN